MTDLRPLRCPYCGADELRFTSADSGLECPGCAATWDGDGAPNRPGAEVEPSTLDVYRERLRARVAQMDDNLAKLDPAGARQQQRAVRRGITYALALLDEVEGEG